jgi:hypothetical protein
MGFCHPEPEKRNDKDRDDFRDRFISKMKKLQSDTGANISKNLAKYNSRV